VLTRGCRLNNRRAGMMALTSPSISGLMEGGWVIAFRATMVFSVLTGGCSPDNGEQERMGARARASRAPPCHLLAGMSRRLETCVADREFLHYRQLNYPKTSEPDASTPLTSELVILVSGT